MDIPVTRYHGKTALPQSLVVGIGNLFREINEKPSCCFDLGYNSKDSTMKTWRLVTSDGVSVASEMVLGASVHKGNEGTPVWFYSAYPFSFWGGREYHQ